LSYRVPSKVGGFRGGVPRCRVALFLNLGCRQARSPRQTAEQNQKSKIKNQNQKLTEEAPAKSKVSWGFRHLDLAIYDAAKPVFMILKKGWN
jgi:hypothetical protein